MLRRRALFGGFVLLRLAVAGAWSLASAGCLSTRGVNVPMGQTAPAFSLESHDGKAVSLDALVAGGPAVLVFYRGHW